MALLDRLRCFRERGWTPIDAAAYAEAWQRFGGSVATHPQVVERLAGLAGIPVRYLGWVADGQLRAAIPTWGRHLALSKDVLKRHGKRGLFDLGNAEIILPAAPDAGAPLRHAARYLSELNQGRFTGLKAQAEQLAMARAHEDLSKKFRYNQRRELRLLEEAGGVVRPISDFSATEIAANDNWTGSDGRQVGAFQLTTGSRDAVLSTNVEARSFTAQVAEWRAFSQAVDDILGAAE